MSLEFSYTQQSSKFQGECVFGYFPCLTDRFGLAKKIEPELIKSIEDELKNIQRIGWLEIPEQKRPTPIFYINSALDVVKHLKEWMNGDLTWFKLVWEVGQSGHYGLALVPDTFRFMQNSDYDPGKILQWIWSFNSKHPNFAVKRHLLQSGSQKVSFADAKTNEIVGHFLFPVAQMSQMSKENHFRVCAANHLKVRK